MPGDTPEEKEQRLLDWLRGLGPVLVAYSGGVDSTYLAVLAHEALGARSLAVTADSPALPRRRLAEACEWARRYGFAHRVIPMDELSLPAYTANAPDRCFHCKHELFRRLVQLARAEGFERVLEGSNVDDLRDYRPGTAALRTWGVISPLQDFGFTKADIRARSRARGLPTADQPAHACLASRIPYGTPITAALLARIEQAEDALADLGFRHVRVRAHDDLARIEVPLTEIGRLLETDVRERVVEALIGAGFRYVTVDLMGYRTGSLNERLTRSPHAA